MITGVTSYLTSNNSKLDVRPSALKTRRRVHWQEVRRGEHLDPFLRYIIMLKKKS